MKRLLFTAAVMLLPAVGLAAHAEAVPGQGLTIADFHGIAGKTTQPYWSLSSKAGVVTFINTLGKKPYTYQGPGYYVNGPESTAPGGETWIALPIQPMKKGSVTEIVAAVTKISGPHLITFAVYDDNQGVPGKLLRSKTFKVTEAFGDCCSVIVDRITGGLAVKGGTTYWVALTLPTKQEKKTSDVWPIATTISNQTVAVSSDGGQSWLTTQTSLPAVAVFGH